MLNREDLCSGTRPEVKGRILVTEKESFEGYQVMDYKGIVWGISIRAKDLVQDFGMGCKNVTGGELSSYTELSDEVRQKAWDRMMDSARRLGANAVINFRFELTPVMYGTGGTSEVIAYGNAVVIQPIKNYVPLGGLGNILAEYVDGSVSNVAPKAEQSGEVSPKADVIDANGALYAVCPTCNMKYKIDYDEKGQAKILNLADVDAKEAGTQIYCIHCGTKFTVPDKQ